ncbi:hypothetical protein [Cohnella soli]|uniref:Butirosin biosynthesis protein H N-terminal domain-containing protein n=1 Tax=Cohnella soli TaxID=425005 RepID=A0ABW0I265_9BACL
MTNMQREDSDLDWRFPDFNGLCDRNLDCRQLAMNTVLKWKQEPQILPCFMDSFNGYHDGLVLARKESPLRMGWKIVKQPLEEVDRAYIQETIGRHGYCILFYNAYDMPFSKYYRVHKVTHWSLVTGSTADHFRLLDHTGIKPYFTGMEGTVAWELFLSNWTEGGLAVLEKDRSDASIWPEVFEGLMKESVHEMIDREGLDNFSRYKDFVKDTPSVSIIASLESLEFHYHHVRRLRELWKASIMKKAIPERFIRGEWVEELFQLCDVWSMTLGVVMKWKRRPDLDHKEKLIYYLNQVAHSEEKFIRFLSQAIGGERS